MSFLDSPRFPDNVSYGATGGAVWQTEIAELDSGVEYRNQSWSHARARYDVSHAARIKTNFDSLVAFFLAVNGRTHGFRFKDWADFAVTAGQGVFSAIDSTHFQLYRRYTAGSLSYNRKITKPVSGTIAITGGSGASVATTTGIVTVSSGTPTAWTGEFDVPCRFDTDAIQSEALSRSGGTLVMGWSSIIIVEVRV